MSVIQERFFFQLFRRPRFSFPLQKNNCFPKATEPRLFYLFSFSNQSLGLETQLAGAAPLLLSAPSDFAMHAAVTHRACAPQGPGRLSRGPVAAATGRPDRLSSAARPADALPRRRRTILASATSSPSSPLLKPRGESGLDIAGSRPTSPKAWEEIKATLRANDARLISAQELVFARDRGGGGGGALPSLLASLPRLPFSSSPAPPGAPSSSPSSSSSSSGSSGGALVLDVRPPDEFRRGHVPGAVNVPLFRPISGLSPRAVARRAVFAFFGVLNGTECNPAFSQEAARALEGRRRVVAYCNAGGSFGSETNGRGTQSRSMSAAYELIRAGICGNNRVRIDMLKGGYNEWMKEREVVVPE